MTTYTITNLLSDTEDLLSLAFSSSPESLESLTRQTADAVSFLPAISEAYWAVISPPCKIATSCYQMALGAYNGLKAYRELRQINLQQDAIELERDPSVVRNLKLTLLSSLCALLHIPNLLHETPGSNPWSALYSLLTRSIGLIRNVTTSSPPTPRQPFQLQADAICTVAAAVFLGVQMGLIPKENFIARYTLSVGGICSGAQIAQTTLGFLTQWANHIAPIDASAHV